LFYLSLLHLSSIAWIDMLISTGSFEKLINLL
jgi:hypothetical protein